MHPRSLRSLGQAASLAIAAISLTACGDREKPAPQTQEAPPAASTSAAEPATAPPPAATPSATPPPASSTAPLATIKPRLPEPFVSTRPFSGNVANLEPVNGSPAAESYQAPEGTRLVSEGMAVSASAAPLQGRLAMLTDGDNSSYPDALLVLPGGGQWVQIDLGNSVAIQKVHVWHAQNLGADVYRDLVVQASDDPQFQKGVTTFYNADADGSLGIGAGADKAYVETHQGRLIDGKGQKARYVRIWGTGSANDQRLRFAEVQVYALP